MKIITIAGQKYQADDDYPEEIINAQNARFAERGEAAVKALPALDRLARILQGRSGQPYKLRGLLYSLYNGKPFSLLEIVGLDWDIRQDLCLVLLAFGHEERNGVKFFYDAIKTAITKAGQWPWFIQEYENINALEEHIKAVKASAS